MNEIAQAVETGVKDVAEHAGARFGKLLKEFYEETGQRMIKSAENVAEAEAKNKAAIEGILKDGEQGLSQDARAAEEGLTGSGPGGLVGGEEPGLGGGGRGGGQSTEGNGRCPNGIDPVDPVSGQMISATVDVQLPGLLPLVLRRAYASGYRSGRLFGPGWSSTLDQRVEIDDDGIHYAGDDAQILHYPMPMQPGQKVLPADGARWPLTWDRATGTIAIEDPFTGWTRLFAGDGESADELAGSRPLTALVDRNGHRITYARDAEGLPTALGHSGGYRLGVDTTYTPCGYRVEAIRLLDGTGGGSGTLLVGFSYDARGRLVGVVNSSGVPYVYEYDDHDRITARIDRLSHRYEYHYGEDGRVAHGVGPEGFLSGSLAYDLDRRVTTITDSLGRTTEYHYDESNHLTKTVDQLGNSILTEYDRYGRLLSHTDQLGNVTRFTLDADGNAVSVTRPDGNEASTVFDALRLPIRVTDADGAVWQNTYDERGNRVSEADPSGATTVYAYDDAGRLTSITDALGNATRFESDGHGLVTSRTDVLGRQVQVRRDAFGRMIAVTDAVGGVTGYGWTVEGRPTWLAAPDGTREEWSYDPAGNLLEHRDPAGGVTRYEYGPFSQPTARTDPDGTRYTFDYDTELRLVAVRNPHGDQWTYTYDDAGNLLSESDFSGRTLTYKLDAAGRVVERVNGAGQRIELTRDFAGRVLERHDSEGGVATFSYDPLGRLLRSASPEHEVEYTRDPVGRVLTESIDGRVLHREYDVLGRTVQRTTPSGAVSAWKYDAVGLPTSLTTAGGVLSFTHDAAGRETTRYLGSESVALAQTWDAAHRLTGQAIWAHGGDAEVGGGEGAQSQHSALQLQWRAYSYRPDGSPTKISDQISGGREYELDLAGRVTAVRAATWTETYAYDGLGNVTSATWADPDRDDAQGERSHTATLIKSAGRTTYVHDGQGRLVRTIRRTLSGQTREQTFTWDADDRLTGTTTPDGTRWRYTYDPLGRRVSKQRLDGDGIVAEQVLFAWEGTRLAEQLGGGGTSTTWDWDPYAHRPVAQRRASQQEIDREFHAIVTDLVGAPTELVTPDGRIAWHQTRSLWGAVIAAPVAETDCPLRFPGQYHDAETGLDYNYHRYYDPATAGYASADPLGLEPAPNPHRYVANPLYWLDPLGLQGGTFYRGSRGEDGPTFQAKPNEYKVDPATGFVKPTHGVSVFDNPESVSGKGFTPNEIDPASVPDTLQIKQRGNDKKHYEIMPAQDANLTPDQYQSELAKIKTVCPGGGE